MWPQYLQQTEDYLRHVLLPFWADRAPERDAGGFNTNFDRMGLPTDVTEKTLLCQARCLFSISHAERLGFEWPGSRDALTRGFAFLDQHFLDRDNGGYFWIVGKEGEILDDRKVIYGHAFLIYAFAEYALLTGDSYGETKARSLFELIASKAADFRHGGFFEHFTRDFRLDSMRPDGLMHKSLDVHMHLMEAFTALYELTGEERHRLALEQVIELIFGNMVDPATGTGIAMFAPDWEAIPNVQLGTLWGSDRFDPTGKPPEVTSYGHNIELAWLYLHAVNVLGGEPRDVRDRVIPIFEHTLERGLDHCHGGIFVEGLRTGPATERNKEFWQQAEALVGFLDAYLLTRDNRFAEAFDNVYRFVFSKMIATPPGEWLPLLSEDGQVIWDYMGHNWKTCYHTVRSMCEVVQRLRQLVK